MIEATLVTESGDFITAAVCKRLQAEERAVAGIDNLNGYCDPSLKLAKPENGKANNWLFEKVDDIVEWVLWVLKEPTQGNQISDRNQPVTASIWAPQRVLNIGNSYSIELMKFISSLEKNLGVFGVKQFKPIQPRDLEKKAAETSALEEWVAFSPAIPIEQVQEAFAHCYHEYYKR